MIQRAQKLFIGLGAQRLGDGKVSNKQAPGIVWAKRPLQRRRRRFSSLKEVQTLLGICPGTELFYLYTWRGMDP